MCNRRLAGVCIKEYASPEVTPFLLARVNELSGGESLRANVALVQAVARFCELHYVPRSASHSPFDIRNLFTSFMA